MHAAGCRDRLQSKTTQPRRGVSMPETTVLDTMTRRVQLRSPYILRLRLFRVLGLNCNQMLQGLPMRLRLRLLCPPWVLTCNQTLEELRMHLRLVPLRPWKGLSATIGLLVLHPPWLDCSKAHDCHSKKYSSYVAGAYAVAGTGDTTHDNDVDKIA